MANDKPPSKYWLDQVIETIIQKYPDGEIIVSSGISPSASYHVGHFREILTVDVIAWALRQAGRKARHIHVVDNFDPLRKRYDFLPKEYEQFVGQPVCLIPDPSGSCHDSYAAHFYSAFETYAKELGIEAETVFSYQDLYKSGKMNTQIEKVLASSAKIREIFEKISERKLPAEWTPVQVIGEDKVMRNGRVDTWDKQQQTINGLAYLDGNAKLNWRLDWPARWQILGVMVEPHGMEHATKGGSYDTGVAFAKQVFGFKPPLAIAQYAFIHLPGETTKMSSSKGNLLTPDQVFKIVPKELPRYFIVKSRPEKTLYFDPTAGIYRLWEEYKEVEAAVANNHDHEFAQAYKVANAHTSSRVTSDVPFDHLVSVYQAARGETERINELLERSGYQNAVNTQADLIKREIGFVKNWLDNFAPENVKFSLQQELPKTELSDKQIAFLSELATSIEKANVLDAQAMHEAIYAAKETADLQPKEAFQAIYRVLFNQDSGPKAGWFLSSLDKSWLNKRLRLQG